jgi:hypothetical protein
MLARVLTGSVCGWLAAMHCCSDAKALKALPGGARVWARSSSSSGAAAASDGHARAAAALQSVASHAMAVLSLAPEADHEFYRRCQVMEKLRPLLKDATDDSETPYRLRHRIIMTRTLDWLRFPYVFGEPVRRLMIVNLMCRSRYMPRTADAILGHIGGGERCVCKSLHCLNAQPTA